MTSSAPSKPSSRARRGFLLRKLHSLSGVVPVGLFLVFHLFTNARALGGEEPFEKAVLDIQALPYLPVLETGLILLPLLFHALYGVKIALEGRPNVGAYPLNRNWMYVAQRVTGVLAFAFVGFHLWELWLKRVTGRLAPEQFYGALCRDLSSVVAGLPLVALAYVFGIAACAFHLANGLWGFCAAWGITPTRRSQRVSATVFGIAGVLIFLLGANTAIYFATGARVAVFGTPADAAVASSRTCPEVLDASRPAPNAPGGMSPGAGSSGAKGDR